ncbi:four-carbon acid sugar kinase family protein [Microbacterium sp. JC 701]|uniref:3-oxo-tetronate kinase n=1 Tax=Microbacterium sp. JC 701 TaxID=2897389 RepID=UPI001E642576|nr:3-oxo-tetronate kinase [Microbacterium sp. JC 701]MCD2168460.1 four-carbon acid sugar kinase family protein [Microbacterium sp. JC 701]
MHIGAIADDFTGATDLATALRERGLRTAVVIGDNDVPADHDAVVVALKSRTAPVAQAVADSLEAGTRLVAAGAERLYVKYCSTFDSTDEGNIGPVLDAVVSMAGADRTIVVPSFPANGRTVRDGSLYVNGTLLEHSSMRHHPLTPMTKSRLRDILAPQTAATLTEIGRDTVRAGTDALRAAIDEAEPGYLIVDAETDDDLAVIAAASRHLRVLSGGAALAAHLDAPADAAAMLFPVVGRGRLVVCGSASAATRAQIAAAVGQGATMRRVDLDAAASDPDAEIAALVAWVRDLPPTELPLICSVTELADIRRDASATADAVEHVLSAVVADLVSTGDIHRVVVAGGETSGAVVQALGVSSLEIGPQLAPGVCWSAGQAASGDTVALVLKSGNFGGTDLFTAAWEAIA